MKIFRALIIPIATLAGAVVTPVLVMPFTAQVHRSGEFVDGTQGNRRGFFNGVAIGSGTD